VVYESNRTLSRRLLIGATIAAVALPAAAVAQTGKPKIGFIGAGHIGGTLAKIWTEAGYQVMLSARNLVPVKELAARLGRNAQVGTPRRRRPGATWWSLPCPMRHFRRLAATMPPS